MADTAWLGCPLFVARYPTFEGMGCAGPVVMVVAMATIIPFPGALPSSMPGPVAAPDRGAEAACLRLVAEILAEVRSAHGGALPAWMRLQCAGAHAVAKYL